MLKRCRAENVLISAGQQAVINGQDQTQYDIYAAPGADDLDNWALSRECLVWVLPVAESTVHRAKRFCGLDFKPPRHFNEYPATLVRDAAGRIHRNRVNSAKWSITAQSQTDGYQPSRLSSTGKSPIPRLPTTSAI